MKNELKLAVTVSEMARMVGLSRSRFYQLVGKTFPEPSRDDLGRPYYAEEQQQVCLEVRRRNCGIDGKPILFYAARIGATSASSNRRPHARKQTPSSKHGAIVESIRGLGLVSVATSQVDQAIHNLFPNGVAGVAFGEVVRKVFLFIKRDNSADKLGG